MSLTNPASISEARRNLVTLHEYREAFFGIQQVARVNSKAPKEAQARSKKHLAVLQLWANELNEEILLNLDYLADGEDLDDLPL